MESLAGIFELIKTFLPKLIEGIFSFLGIKVELFPEQKK